MRDEPDKAQWEHKGFSCRARRGPLGHWCGYVELEEGHPLYGVVDNDDRVTALNVHGGVTWADPYNGEGWAIGFDCAHVGDYVPRGPFLSVGDVYRDLNFVREETNRLADQLRAMTEDAS